MPPHLLDAVDVGIGLGVVRVRVTLEERHRQMLAERPEAGVHLRRNRPRLGPRGEISRPQPGVGIGLGKVFPDRDRVPHPDLATFAAEHEQRHLAGRGKLVEALLALRGTVAEQGFLESKRPPCAASASRAATMMKPSGSRCKSEGQA